MLEKIKDKVTRQIIRLTVMVQNEKGNLPTFATIAGLTFVAVMLILAGYEILKIFFPDFLNGMLNVIKQKFTIQ
ncbi:hypothetical protein GFC01_17255 [Desulfofundulus thermobenzoicus]|uniref:Uncharacterized protein n=1 Tax=Desulfofundulus thermobenzoicus TaxID=29376 RepID=A0A6N7IWI4_9FIRM|nr:hypothetical protein [Desulfofundulus thermobenzoicus]MQL53973.1 hypothetical protein [Desulfofundulus thermobenzoicus]